MQRNRSGRLNDSPRDPLATTFFSPGSSPRTKPAEENLGPVKRPLNYHSFVHYTLQQTAVLKRLTQKGEVSPSPTVAASALQDGNIGLINAEIIESTGTEGGNITVRCSFTFPGKRRIFCKDECKDGDILIETEEDTAKKDRYSIEYKEGYIPVFKTILYVSIRNLTQSDSGRYRCGLFRFYSSSPSYWEIEIRVTDGLVLYVRLPLVVLVIVLSVAALIFCRKRARKPNEPPLETEYSNVTEANRVYEEIREDRQSTSPPLEVSTVYTFHRSQFSEESKLKLWWDFSFGFRKQCL
ncbi:hypothetical protein PFLUV_G00053100 [Perca fluviatilis]|uniref:Immunoglobulin subtype domain-containing protein n=1 Tax=Perca fluviatilis TaxID=8168 RepID=A0A6A5FE04_PERFL|nr:hypothetical protein PFLUV_G00053100 [Perca fluviatilis]